MLGARLWRSDASYTRAWRGDWQHGGGTLSGSLSDLLEVARDRRIYSQIKANSHYALAASADSRSRWLGIPAAVASTIVGTTIFATLSTGDRVLWVQVGTGSLSVAAAVLAGLQTLLKYPEAAAQHQKAAAGYDAVHHSLDHFLLTYAQSDGAKRDVAVEQLREIGEDLDNLASSSPNVPERVYERCAAAFRIPKSVSTR
jgi:hypothetical protein